MSSFGRSCEKLASGAVDFVDGVNQRLDENHLVDMIVTLQDEDISISKFTEFTETIQALRKGKKSTTKPTTGTTSA